ncbi:MAG TPA: SGNH/GDSL hydrolase family protein [Burkholderiaceae bacterium]|nr:SGNH/GDSL hydrolase family protein [Burkholderiaceae bacterium]
MTANPLRRLLLALTCATAGLLAACGSGSIVDPFTPTRVLSVGDSFSDLGQDGKRYTVNDDTVNIWSQQAAINWGLPLVASNKGGLSYARGDALVAGPTGNTIEAQVTELLSKNTLQKGDLVLVNGGVADVLTNVAAHGFSAQATANVEAAGAALGAQVLRLVNAGATHVLVGGLYPLGLSPLGVSTQQGTNFTNITLAFNNALKLSMVNLGANVLYLDSSQYFSNVYYNPTAYPPLDNSSTVACTTVLVTDCTPATITPGFDYNTLLYASSVYFTPTAHRLLGNYAFNRVKDRW